MVFLDWLYLWVLRLGNVYTVTVFLKSLGLEKCKLPLKDFVWGGAQRRSGY